ncbi:ABC transporter ATP-binding protein [Salisaeta longa]|uniref:ABC transporter ATP-binding protein n=1 Tax=Salisaeta longa TaxID=503170 RepID=UPI0003B628ED|nr:ABC transporter ATP-binding protein [Salisaeta longa]
MADALVIDALTKRYGTHAPVLRDLSHTFAPGTCTLITGPNGAGKTTLLRVLTAQALPTAGRVRYGSLDIHQQPRAFLQHAGIVPASADLPAQLSAVELLLWVLRSRRPTADAPDATAQALLDRLTLDERRTRRIGTYSSGMTQKALIGAALVAQPAVLIMDEPLRSLDTDAIAATVALVREHVARGGTAIVSSHQTDALAALADAHLTLGR